MKKYILLTTIAFSMLSAMDTKIDPENHKTKLITNTINLSLEEQELKINSEMTLVQSQLKQVKAERELLKLKKELELEKYLLGCQEIQLEGVKFIYKRKLEQDWMDDVIPLPITLQPENDKPGYVYNPKIWLPFSKLEIKRISNNELFAKQLILGMTDILDISSVDVSKFQCMAYENIESLEIKQQNNKPM